MANPWEEVFGTPQGTSPAAPTNPWAEVFGGSTYTGQLAQAGQALLETEAGKAATGLAGTVFDLLSRGQYASANATRAIINRQWSDLGKSIVLGLAGKQKGSYQDVIDQLWPDAPGWVKGLGGFIGDVLLDPTTYLTFGTGAAGKAAFIGGKEIAGSAKVLGAAERAGKAAAQSASKTKPAQWLASKGVTLDWLRQHFSPRYGYTDEDLYRLQLLMKAQARALEEDALRKGLTREQWVRQMEEQYKIPRNVLAELVERPTNEAGVSRIPELLPGLSPEGEKTVRQFIDELARDAEERLAIEQAAGINVKALRSDRINYLTHYMTPEARQAMKALGNGNPYEGFAALLGRRVQHGSTREREIRDLTIAEINQLSEQGKLIPGYKGKIFIDDPVVAATIRDVIGGRAIAAANLIEELKKNPEWALPADKAPRDWKPLLEERFGKVAEGYVFHPDVHWHLTNYIKKAFDPEEIDGFLKVYDSALGAWRTLTLGFNPKWMLNNIIGNAWNNWLANVKASSYLKAAQAMATAKEYVVKPGDTLSGIAKQFGVSVEELAKLNGIKDPNRILTGQVLRMPATGKIGRYTVREVMDMARKLGVIDSGLYGHNVEKALASGLSPDKLRAFGQAATRQPLFTANRLVENHARLAHFIDRLEKGMKPEDAAMSVRKYLFDYTELTDTERNVLRRYAPFYCVPEDCRILTRDGWKSHEELKEGDEVLTYNVEADTLEWQPCLGVAKFEYNGELMHVKNTDVHFSFTPNHRWPVEDQDGQRRVVSGYGLRSNHKLILTGKYENKESCFTPREAAILGWVVTDGHYRRRRGRHMVIYQAPHKHLQRILDLVGEDGVAGKPHPDSGVVPVRLRASIVNRLCEVFSGKEDLPRIVTRLSTEAAEAMYEAMMAAEGHICRNGTQQHFAQKPGPVLEAFQILCLLLGKPARLSGRGCYVKSRKRLKVTGTLGTEWYKGVVWCPQTPNGTWVMERNGSVVITGNSWQRKNIPLQLEQLAKQPGKYAVIPKGVTAVEGPQENRQDKRTLPEWLQGMVPLQVGTTEQGSNVFYPLSGIPAMDVLRLFEAETYLAQNPFINAAAALGGIDLYRGEAIQDPWDRAATAIQGLVPPLRTAAYVAAPAESSVTETPDLRTRLLAALTGTRTYLRNPVADAYHTRQNLFDEIQRLRREAARTDNPIYRAYLETLIEQKQQQLQSM